MLPVCRRAQACLNQSDIHPITLIANQSEGLIHKPITHPDHSLLSLPVESSEFRPWALAAWTPCLAPHSVALSFTTTMPFQRLALLHRQQTWGLFAPGQQKAGGEGGRTEGEIRS